MAKLIDSPAHLEFEAAIRALQRDWSFLSPRLRTLDHTVSTNCANLNLRLHYPAIRQAQPMVESLIDALGNFIAHFALPRAEIEEVYARKDALDPFDFHAELTRLNDRARELFQKARPDSGEAGELILYILTEWILEAPQIVAKMSLKTSSAMPVYGSDGVHVKFDSATNRLMIYSGEAKLHKDVRSAIKSAVESIGNALSFDKMKHELELVQRNVQFSGLDEKARRALLRYLDPFSEESNDRLEVVTCLIGFNFEAYLDVAKLGDKAEEAFQDLASKHLSDLGPAMATALEGAGLENSHVELFFLPLPSVQDVRDRFKNFIGPKA
jgi:hypothetical protein